MQLSFRRRYKKRLFGLLIISFIFFGCKKFINIGPPVTSVNQENVYAADATAISVLDALYINMSTGGIFSGGGDISLFAGLSADEFNLWSGLSTDNRYYYFTNALSTNTAGQPGTEFWTPLYSENGIFTCNLTIEGLNASTSLTPAVKTQLLGEAKFLRAFYYFYLVNLYGDVPLLLSSDWQVNATAGRTPASQVYIQIIQDLKDAQSLLSPNYLDGNLQVYSSTPERVRPTQGAATALLARAYLYSGDYADGETEASLVISNSSQYSLDTLNGVFLKNSTEAIWQLQPVVPGHNTEDGWTFILPETGPGDSWPVYLSPILLNSFEPGDLRRINWVDSVIVASDTFYYPYKYKSATLDADVSEYLMVLRLSEQYLIRAEAEAQLSESTAIVDLNVVRQRAGLQPYSGATDKASLLSAILHEKQVELFSEWGHRWLDLKRTNNVNSVMNIATPLKTGGAGIWNSFQQLYPLPLADIQEDQNLTQNPGY